MNASRTLEPRGRDRGGTSGLGEDGSIVGSPTTAKRSRSVALELIDQLIVDGALPRKWLSWLAPIPHPRVSVPRAV